MQRTPLSLGLGVELVIKIIIPASPQVRKSLMKIWLNKVTKNLINSFFRNVKGFIKLTNMQEKIVDN